MAVRPSWRIRNEMLRLGTNPTEAQLDERVAALMQMSPELIAKLEDSA